MTKGSFGYKIGRKVRLMRIEHDADLLWQICVREIYVLIKHYGSVELLRHAFDKLLDAKNKPKLEAIEKCKPFTDLEISNKSTNDWYCLTRYCQHSFINILESGYFLNNGDDLGQVFILDFNTNSVRFYGKDLNKEVIEYDKATINEIMEYEGMPIKTYTEIVCEMRERYENYSKNLEKINIEIENINKIIRRANELGGDQNIISKAKELLDDICWEKKKLEMNYRVFYHRLDALNLIDHS